MAVHASNVLAKVTLFNLFPCYYLLVFLGSGIEMRTSYGRLVRCLLCCDCFRHRTEKFESEETEQTTSTAQKDHDSDAGVLRSQSSRRTVVDHDGGEAQNLTTAVVESSDCLYDADEEANFSRTSSQ